MKQDYLILLPFAGLVLLVLILAIIAWAKFRKLEKGILPDDDFPGRYEEAERPFIEFN